MANAVIDGADAFLLGAETLRGRNPVLTVSGPQPWEGPDTFVSRGAAFVSPLRPLASGLAVSCGALGIALEHGARRSRGVILFGASSTAAARVCRTAVH